MSATKRFSDVADQAASGSPKKRPKVERTQTAKPEFHFNLKGFEGGRKIEIHWLRDFVLHLLSPGQGKKDPPWIQTNNKAAIAHVVALLVPGITPETFGLPAAVPSKNKPVALARERPADNKLPLITQLFAHYCPTKAPGDKYKIHSVVQTFLSVPMSDVRKAKRDAEDAQRDVVKGEPLVHLLPSAEMFEAGYPMPSYDIEGQPGSSRPKAPWSEWQKENGMIETPRGAGEDGPPKLFGVDCEMVVTEGGSSEVARVSVVDGSGQTVYDTLIMPERRITDYVTPWSGMTEERLRDVTTRLQDVQKQLSQLFDYNTILCGHSLDCDLRVLKLAHPWVIDTAVAYHHTRGPPFKPSLKWLAEKHLKRHIQQPASKEVGPNIRVGHDSTEDALAAVDLVKLKIANGSSFGQVKSDKESIFETLGNADTPKRTAVVDHGQPAQFHGAKADTAVACTNDEQIEAGLLQSVGSHDFTFARLLDLSHALGWSEPSVAAVRQAATTQLIDTPQTAGINGMDEPVDEAARIERALSQLDARLARVHASLPPHTALIIFSGQSDPRPMTALHRQKASFDRFWKAKPNMTPAQVAEAEKTERWSESDERKLFEEVEKARCGLALLCVTKSSV